MATTAHGFTTITDSLVSRVRERLGSPDPRTRVRAIHRLAVGVEALERQGLLDAQSSGVTWAQIGEIYGVSRQAAHRRFSDETVVPSGFFDQLLDEVDDDRDIVPTLAKAARRVRRTTSA